MNTLLELKELLADMRSYPVQSWMCGWLERIITDLEQQLMSNYSNDPKSFFDLEKVRAILAASQSTVLGRIKQCPGDQTDRVRGCSQHNFDMSGKKRNFDQTIYWFPPHYNLLRQELYENWKTLWALVGWAMAFRAEMFIEYMNDALDMGLALDSDAVDWTCEQYLIELRRRRLAAMSDIKE